MWRASGLNRLPVPVTPDWGRLSRTRNGPPNDISTPQTTDSHVIRPRGNVGSIQAGCRLDVDAGVLSALECMLNIFRRELATSNANRQQSWNRWGHSSTSSIKVDGVGRRGKLEMDLGGAFIDLLNKSHDHDNRNKLLRNMSRTIKCLHPEEYELGKFVDASDMYKLFANMFLEPTQVLNGEFMYNRSGRVLVRHWSKRFTSLSVKPFASLKEYPNIVEPIKMSTILEKGMRSRKVKAGQEFTELRMFFPDHTDRLVVSVTSDDRMGGTLI